MGAPRHDGPRAAGREAGGELHRQQQRFEPVLEIIPTAFVITDLDARVLSWNPAAQRLFGYSAAEAIGRNLDDLVAATDELHADAVAIGERASRDQHHVRTITRRTRKDGTLVDVEVLAAPLLVDDGRVVGTLASYHDITELNRQRRFFESLLEVSPEAIVTTDLDDIVTSWNPAAERLFGYKVEEAVGRDLDDLVSRRPDLHAEGKELGRGAMVAPTAHLVTQRMGKDGSLVDVDIVGGPVVVGGDLVAKHVFYHDVTELQEQKRYFESLLEISPTAIVITDLESRIVSWNPAAERLFGYTAEEAIDRLVDDIVATRPDLHDEALSINDAARRGERLQVITRRTRRDGSLVDVELLVAPVTVGGHDVGFYLIYHDITEVQQQKRWLESVLKLSPTAIITVDDETKVTSWNPAAERLFGYTAEEAIGSPLDDLVAKAPEIREEAARYSAEGIGGKQVRVITRRTRKDGSLVDVELLVAPVLIGGERVGHSVIYHDIGGIQRQKRYYEALVQWSPIAIVLMDPDGTVTSWNPAAERLFGYAAEDAIGRNIDDLVATDASVRAEAEAQTKRGIGGQHVHTITKRTRKDGTLLDVEVFGAPVIVSGEAVGLYGLYHDIGELQRAREEAEAATETKSAFLATMSHEIRTPLNAVIGMTGLLLDTELAAEQRHFAEVIRSSGDALLGVINDILDFSKIEAGRLELETAPFDLRACVESALELVAPAATEKGLDLAYELDRDAPRGVVGDLTRLRQILINLLNNAVKFTQQGEVVVTVSAERMDASERFRLTFAVRDTGIGIPEDRMDRLFESFSQLDASTTRRYGGTGLGLAISRRLVELMGGSMWAESAAGTGSTFRFTIEAEGAAVPSRPFDLSHAPGLLGKRVLVVDDNATNRQILARQAGSWGMLVRETGSPAIALDWIGADDHFDVAIVDMQMPEMDGLMLAHAIRRVRVDLPLVMLTSLGRTGDVPKAMFAAYLTKPIRPSHLYDALQSVFGADPAEQAERPDVLPEPDEHLADGLPLRILVVEDNAVNQQLSLLLLLKLGYRADVAANGVEALEALERQPYDVVLMDVEMPEMDGLEATRRIRRMPAEEGRPHIIAVTANAMQGERELCLQAGMNDYLTKPIRMDELIDALGRGTRMSDVPPAPAVDFQVIRRLVASLGEQGHESVSELIGMFLNHAPEQLAALRKALMRREADDARRAAHTLKSNAAAFGAALLADVCGDVESAAKAGALDPGDELLPRITTELERVTGELRQIRAELDR